MSTPINPLQNFEDSKQAIGYVSRKQAVRDDYKRIGFMSGLEVHQQLKTKNKLFCQCPAGVFHKSSDFDAQLIRHMRPTLSELGEYDGTALMEFKTKKEIVYRIKNKTTCTYEIDDTPPFPINREALEYALEISLLSKLNIVGEVHITRKQYLDGSIPTGFQRTAILGVEGAIQLKNKKVRLIQLSIEEDSCREVSDIGHQRIYRTDRLGMPLIETVTYPDLFTPDELMEAAEYIRFLNRSTGKVRTGIGSGREDVNVSCRGGSRVEIKGVSHNRWIPELSHIEAFRQFALLRIRDILNERVKNVQNWKISSQELDYHDFKFKHQYLLEAKERGDKIIAVNLPKFKGILSHFTQPAKPFADELVNRLKVIACIEKPNMIHSEELTTEFFNEEFFGHFAKIGDLLLVGSDDAQIILFGPKADIPTALDVIEERCRMAFAGVPPETRKSYENGTTIFERVLPGADRMYPDTDSAPIPLEDSYIEHLKKNMPIDVVERYQQLKAWEIPADTFKYLLKKNLLPLIERMVTELNLKPKMVCTFFAHTLKNIEGKKPVHKNFSHTKVFGLLSYIVKNNLDIAIAKDMLPILYQYPDMEFNSILTSLKFRKRSKDELFAPVDFLLEKFKDISPTKSPDVAVRWIMGQIRRQAVGNIDFKELKAEIYKRLEN